MWGTKNTGENAQSHKGLLPLPKALPRLLQALPCLGPLLAFPHQPAPLRPVVLSKAVLDGVPGHEDSWPRTSVPTVTSLLLLASLSLQVNQEC